MGTKDDDEEKYSLYTEKVVLHPAKRFRWLIRIGKVVLFAAAVVVIAMASQYFLYPVLKDRLESDDEDKEVVYIQKDDYVSDEEYTQDEGILTEQDLKKNYEDAMSALRTEVENVKKNVVTVDIEQQFTEVPTTETSKTEMSGIIIADISSDYMILTSAQLLDISGTYTVTIADSVKVTATAVCKDEATGIGIVSVESDSIPDEVKSTLTTAPLGNSYMVHQGDLVIATGRIYDASDTVDYGTIAGIKTEYGKDSGYEVLETNIASVPGGFGFLFNSEGSVVGISKTSDSTTMKFIGISDLKAKIEKMINDKGIMYCGITGQDVTSELAATYGLPSGVYISAVDIDSPAYYAGLQAGDIITSVNGQNVLTILQFSAKLYQCSDGDTMTVVAKRLGKDGYSDTEFNITVQLKQL